MKSTTLSINNHYFTIYIANTPDQIQKGLMFRTYLPSKTGMLFIFPTVDYYSMWMKNTYIPLDILFIDETFTIVDIYTCAQPLDLTYITSKKKCKYAIELNCGEVFLYKIKVGQNLL
jgi:uncharacterized protein